METRVSHTLITTIDSWRTEIADASIDIGWHVVETALPNKDGDIGCQSWHGHD